MENIEGQIKRLYLMPNNVDRAKKISAIIYYLAYLYESGQISEDVYNKYIIDLDGLIALSGNKLINHAYGLAPCIDVNITNKLLSMYKSVLTYANKYPTYGTVFYECNFDKLIDCCAEFFQYMGDDVYELFLKLLDKGLICRAMATGYGGRTFPNFDTGESSIIIDEKNSNMLKAFSLVHEMGHAYHFYLDRNHNTDFNSLSIELMSTIFENLFLEFLKEHHSIKKKCTDLYERYDYLYDLGLMNATYILNKKIAEYRTPHLNISDIKLELTDEEFKDLSLFNNKNQFYKQYVSTYYNRYPFACMFAKVIREYFIKDDQFTIALVKELPYILRDLSDMEIINLFSKTDYINTMNKNTSRILTKTR